MIVFVFFFQMSYAQRFEGVFEMIDYESNITLDKDPLKRANEIPFKTQLRIFENKSFKFVVFKEGFPLAECFGNWYQHGSNIYFTKTYVDKACHGIVITKVKKRTNPSLKREKVIKIIDVTIDTVLFAGVSIYAKSGKYLQGPTDSIMIDMNDSKIDIEFMGLSAEYKFESNSEENCYDFYVCWGLIEDFPDIELPFKFLTIIGNGTLADTSKKILFKSLRYK
ncbi:MAG: hypothetical protein HYZ42_11825 [Bacteroidetes bacterium]|nr:hypothetical protein [Bacteroidota bacterium]